MKRFGIVFLSLIINTIVLIHMVVPHHHHGDLPCFKNHIEQSCCTHNHNEHGRHTGHHDCTSHEHPEENVSCLFEQALLLNNQNEKNEHHCDVCLHHHNNHLIQAVLLSYNYEFYIPDKEKGSDNPPPYLITYYSINVSRISGLRAPPVA